MIRRLIWLAIGALGGIVAYRKLASLAGALGGMPGRARRGVRGDSHGGSPVGAVTSFVRDVRTGMAEYAVRQPGYIDRRARPAGNTLVGQQRRRGELARGGDDNQDDNQKDGR